MQTRKQTRTKREIERASRIPALPSVLWDEIREKSRFQYTPLQKSDLENSFYNSMSGAVLGRKKPDCSKYGDCAADCQELSTLPDYVSLHVSLDENEYSVFMTHALAPLLDNTNSLFITTEDPMDDSTVHLARATSRCKMLTLIGRPSIDEVGFHVPGSVRASQLCLVYYKYINDMKNKQAERFLEFASKTANIVLIEHAFYSVEDGKLKVQPLLYDRLNDTVQFPFSDENVVSAIFFYASVKRRLQIYLYEGVNEYKVFLMNSKKQRIPPRMVDARTGYVAATI